MEKSRVLHKLPITIWLTVILQGFLFHTACFAVQGNSLSVYFITRENKRLAGHDIKRFNSPSFFSCIHSCLRNKWCTSINFKVSLKQDNRGTCELNKHEIGSFTGDTSLVDQPGFTFSTSFPGSLLFTPQEAREGRPWLGLVTRLPKSGRLQISDWREGRLSVSLPILSVPGMGKHAPVRISE